VLVIASGSFVRPALVAEPLDALRAAHGLAPDPQLARLRRHLVLSPFPPSLREPAFPLPPAAHSIRLDAAGGAGDGDPLASWAARRAGAPLVYLTLGTVFNLESGDLFSRALAGLRDLPVDLVVTVGRQLDPEELGPQPANVHLARYIPQSSLLPRCDLVVSHGGSGSVLGALAHGLPMVLLPIGADQPRNAARCAELGIARVLDAVAATPEHVAEAVSAALADPGARRAAERMRDELAALPGPAHAVHLLERLAEDERRESP
jgi:MGT family glycosyltransferase